MPSAWVITGRPSRGSTPTWDAPSSRWRRPFSTRCRPARSSTTCCACAPAAPSSPPERSHYRCAAGAPSALRADCQLPLLVLRAVFRRRRAAGGGGAALQPHLDLLSRRGGIARLDAPRAGLPPGGSAPVRTVRLALAPRAAAARAVQGVIAGPVAQSRASQ